VKHETPEWLTFIAEFLTFVLVMAFVILGPPILYGVLYG
jgi:hypothetical protein